MGSSAWFADLVHRELRDRYERHCSRAGGSPVPPPDATFAGTVAEITGHPGESDTAAASVQYAGEVYEHLLRRWPDPRWRTMVAVAREMESCEQLAGTTAPSGLPAANGKRHYRSAGTFSREHTLASAASKT